MKTINEILARTTRSENGCMLFPCSSTNRYGRVRVYGESMHAHRAAYLLAKGPIPQGFQVCHTCDTPGCVNPEHLVLGAPSENVRQAVERRSIPKYTPADASLVRGLKQLGYAIPQIVRMTGLSRSAVDGLIYASDERVLTQAAQDFLRTRSIQDLPHKLVQIQQTIAGQVGVLLRCYEELSQFAEGCDDPSIATTAKNAQERVAYAAAALREMTWTRKLTSQNT